VVEIEAGPIIASAPLFLKKAVVETDHLIWSWKTRLGVAKTLGESTETHMLGDRGQLAS